MKSCLYCGACSWKPGPKVVASDIEYFRCEHCNTVARRDLLEAPALGAYFARPTIDPTFVAGLELFQQALLRLEIPRTEKLMTAIASSGWNGRYVEEVGVTFAARTLVAFVRAIEHELDHVPAPRLECGHVADGSMCDVTCSKGYRGE